MCEGKALLIAEGTRMEVRGRREGKGRAGCLLARRTTRFGVEGKGAGGGISANGTGFEGKGDSADGTGHKADLKKNPFSHQNFFKI